jgi:predicted nucleotidyltransferase
MCIINKLNREIIKNNVKFIELINLLNPISVILYGSYSVNKQTDNSDIDLLIIFNKNILNKYINIDNFIIKFKKEIIRLFNKKVDIVVMIKINKINYIIDDIYVNNDTYINNDTNFIYNVYADSYIIYGNKNKDIILESIKYKKF